MIKEMLKTAGVDNMEDFYKLHPTEEHFFKTYPHMKDKVKKGNKIRKPAYAKGGIHINPAKKGTFTAQATRMGMGVQEAAKHILAHKDRYSSKMVKKANFARNASKWKHEDGGPTGEEQMMQIIQTYAQMANISPEEIIKKLQSLPPEQQQSAIQQMMQAVQPQQAAYGGRMMNKYGYGTAGVQPQGAQTNSQGYTMQRGVAVPVPSRAYGGYYQEGGEAMPQEMMEAPQQQMQEQAMGQEQQQGGQDQMMQQLMQMVMQALQEGMQPEQIMQMLVQQGVPEDVAMQVVQMVMQQMGGGAPQGGPGQQYQPQGGQYQGPQPMAAMGGYYANGGINNAGFRALPASVQQNIMDNMAYGGYYEDGGFFNQSYMPFDY